jgi:hypothetical protein
MLKYRPVEEEGAEKKLARRLRKFIHPSLRDYDHKS